MTKGLWKGKPLEEYSKDELIEIIMIMARENNSLITSGNKFMNAISSRY